MTILQIENDGKQIIKTNYFISEYAQRNYLYLSPNAGYMRVLVPQGIETDITKELTKRYFLVYGFHPQYQRTMVELIFDDHSLQPFSVQISEGQIQYKISDRDRIIPILFYNSKLELLQEAKVLLAEVSTLPVSIPDLRKLRKKT